VQIEKLLKRELKAGPLFLYSSSSLPSSSASSHLSSFLFPLSSLLPPP
jgi:hypothetical protein